MIIHSDFAGGNIKTVRRSGNEVYLENELRDSGQDWFYWAFCVEDAAGQTVTFRFQENRLGYFGPAVSHDLVNWKWLSETDKSRHSFLYGKNSFTYTFGKDENRVFFAHSMLYHPDRFLRFAAAHGLEVSEFCRSRKGRSVPYTVFGCGKRSVILTARHHACESTGSYVLEGVLSELLRDPLPDAKVLCVPFVDYDGVIDGDQGKARRPHDHNRDYDKNQPSIYPETAEIRRYADEHGCHCGFDFHSPWHIGDVNDCMFIVQNSFEKADRLDAFGKLLESEMTEKAFRYRHENDYPFMHGWNLKSNNFSQYMISRPENVLAFTLETAYFGTQQNRVDQKNLTVSGRCFAKALRKYIENYGATEKIF